MSNLNKEEYDFIVGFTLFRPNGFRTMYRHFDNLEVAKMFASNVNIKDNHKIYVDLDLYNKEKEKNKELDREAQGYLEELAGDETLISILYQKEKEKNKILEEKQNSLAFKTNDYMNKVLSKNIISKDKIRSKIKELDDIKLLGNNIHKDIIENEIKILQELLEE